MVQSDGAADKFKGKTVTLEAGWLCLHHTSPLNASSGDIPALPENPGGQGMAVLEPVTGQVVRNPVEVGARVKLALEGFPLLPAFF